MGAAHAVGLARRMPTVEPVMPDDAVVLCTFGDASVNHSTALGAPSTAPPGRATQGSPMPIVFVCEDTGIGISTIPRPAGSRRPTYSGREGILSIDLDGIWALAGTEAVVGALLARLPSVDERFPPAGRTCRVPYAVARACGRACPRDAAGLPVPSSHSPLDRRPGPHLAAAHHRAVGVARIHACRASQTTRHPRARTTCA